jgi:hypothetical protein
MSKIPYYTTTAAGSIAMVGGVVAAVTMSSAAGAVTVLAWAVSLVAMGVDCYQLPQDVYEVESMTIKMRWYDYTIPALVGYPVAWALYVHGRYHINRAETGAPNQPAATPGIQ